MSYLGAEPTQQMTTVGTNTVETQDIQDGAVTAAKLAAGAAVPSQTGNANKFLTTDGTTASWSDLSNPIDGGLANSVYITSQIINGGTANG